MPHRTCKICDHRFEFDESDRGEFVECPQCHNAIEIEESWLPKLDEDIADRPFNGENPIEIFNDASKEVNHAASLLQIYAYIIGALSILVLLIVIASFLVNYLIDNNLSFHILRIGGWAVSAFLYSLVIRYLSIRIREFQTTFWGYLTGLVCLVPSIYFITMTILSSISACVPIVLMMSLFPGIAAIKAMMNTSVRQVIEWNRKNSPNDA